MASNIFLSNSSNSPYFKLSSFWYHCRVTILSGHKTLLKFTTHNGKIKPEIFFHLTYPYAAADDGSDEFQDIARHRRLSPGEGAAGRYAGTHRIPGGELFAQLLHDLTEHRLHPGFVLINGVGLDAEPGGDLFGGKIFPDETKN